MLSPHQAAVLVEDKERLLLALQKKVASLERRLEGNLSQDEHLQELLQEVKRRLGPRLLSLPLSSLTDN